MCYSWKEIILVLLYCFVTAYFYFLILNELVIKEKMFKAYGMKIRYNASRGNYYEDFGVFL